MKQQIWVSKYALSKGITEHIAEQNAGRVFPGEPFLPTVGFSMGIDAHSTNEGAIKAAEILREKKIASLKKQIAKLEATTF